MILYFAMLAGADVAPLAEDQLQSLIRLAQAGDNAAAQRLYRQFVNRVYRTLRPMFASDAETEDATQDALLRVLLNVHRYKPHDGKNFSTWVITVALNTARKRFRKKRLVLVAPETLNAVADNRSTAAQNAEQQELRAALLKALSALPERDRDIMCLRYGAELDANEVGEIMKVSAANVRKICERQSALLQTQLEEHHHG